MQEPESISASLSCYGIDVGSNYISRCSMKNPLNNILNLTEEELSGWLDLQGSREKKQSCKA